MDWIPELNSCPPRCLGTKPTVRVEFLAASLRVDGAGVVHVHEGVGALACGVQGRSDSVISPAVPEGRQLLRTSYMATHTDEQMSRVLETFAKVGKQVGLIS